MGDDSGRLRLTRGADRRPRKPSGESVPKVAREASTSVCASLGLDTAGSAIPYMAGWSESAGADPIESYAALIDRLARRLEQVTLSEEPAANIR